MFFAQHTAVMVKLTFNLLGMNVITSSFKPIWNLCRILSNLTYEFLRYGHMLYDVTIIPDLWPNHPWEWLTYVPDVIEIPWLCHWDIVFTIIRWTKGPNDLWPAKSNQFFLESNWKSEPNFLACIPAKSCWHHWDVQPKNIIPPLLLFLVQRRKVLTVFKCIQRQIT